MTIRPCISALSAFPSAARHSFVIVLLLSLLLGSCGSPSGDISNSTATPKTSGAASAPTFAWRTVLSRNDVQLFGAIDCLTLQRCVSGGHTSTTGGMLTTADGGATWVWNEIVGSRDVPSLSCPTAQLCYAIAQKQDGDSVVLMSSDGGSSWRTVSNPNAPTGFGLIYCTSSVDCIAAGFVGLQGALWSTHDGAMSWRRAVITIASRNEIASLYCSSNVRCWATAVGGAAAATYTSTSGGDTWLPTDGVSGQVACVAAHRCWSVDGSSIRSSSDGGQTWHTQQVPAHIYFLSSVACLDATDCYAVGGHDAVRMTSGGTWSLGQVPAGVFIHDVACAARCFAVGESGNRGVVLALAP